MVRRLPVLAVLLALCPSLPGQPGGRSQSPVEVSFRNSTVEWMPLVPIEGCVLTVSGPDGYYLKQQYGTNFRPKFGVVDEKGAPLPEGLYRWELVAQLPAGAGGEVPDEPNPVVSGSFVIGGGTIIPKPDDAQPAMVEEGAPLRSLFLDREGRLGMGTAVPQSQLHLKGMAPAFTLEDTTTGGGAFTLRGLERGDGSLGLFDKAGQARWFTDGEGRIGINTTKPTSALTVDGYIEATKGFLVNGKPVGGTGFGLIGGSRPLEYEAPYDTAFGSGAGELAKPFSINGIPVDYWDLGNAFFGTNSGHDTLGKLNSFFGYESGHNTSNGSYNCFFGDFSGHLNQIGEKNSFFGHESGYNNLASYNSFFGNKAGYSNTTGTRNAFFANGAGYSNQIGDYNAFFGETAGYSNVDGGYNAFFGNGAGYTNNASNNAFFGNLAGYLNGTGEWNSFFGSEAGRRNTTGAHNAFFGGQAGDHNTVGNYNSYFGRAAGQANLTGISNSFFGFNSGYQNLSSENSFFGSQAGSSNVSGSQNSFYGRAAGYSNNSGHSLSFYGAFAGYYNTSGAFSSFFGVNAGFSNTTGHSNSFFGTNAGHENTIGNSNSFFGLNAGWSNTTGSSNALFGQEAGFWSTTGNNNSSFGRYAGNHNTVESYNTFIGYGADIGPGADPATAPVTNATAIGANALVAQSNSLVLGSIPGVNLGTSHVNVGIGTTKPARQLHLAGPQAVFRMDRPSDTAAFIMVRTDANGVPWKTFVVGTNASGPDQGEFIINDLGSAVGGGGNRRMTITNDGDVEFTGTVTALDFASPSSIALKTNVHTLENAIEMVNRLRGVRFNWKDSGKPAVGLIAEEVNEVVPEVVAHEGGSAKGVNYANLVAVLVEAVKEQQKTSEKDRRTIREQQAKIEQQQLAFDSLKAEVEKLKVLLQAR